MPYIISRFGGTVLPQYEGSNDVGAGEAQTAFVEMIGGGVFDALGDEDARRVRRQITKKGEIVATDAVNFRTQVNTLRPLLGTRDQLWRTWDDGTEEWVEARFISLQAERPAGNILHQEFAMVFEVLSEQWNATSQSTVNDYLDTTPVNIVLTNNGNALVRNAIITLTVPATISLTSVTKLLFSAGNAEFEYTGSLIANDVLVIDTGARSVTKNGSDDYGNFSLTSNHAISEWLRLAAGANTLAVTVEPSAEALPTDVADLTGYATGLIGPPTYSSGSITAGKVDVQVSFYDQWR